MMSNMLKGDDDIDDFIDDMMETLEKEGTSYDMCLKAMSSAIVNAKQPLSFNEWAYAAQVDCLGRKKYSQDIFSPEAVKAVILYLLGNNTVIRIGQQSFCKASIVDHMAKFIDGALLLHVVPVDLEELAELLMKSKHTEAFNVRRVSIKNFIEEKIVKLALDKSKKILVIGDEYVHRSNIVTAVNHTINIIEDKTLRAMTKESFFDHILRFNIQGLERIKEMLRHPDVQSLVLHQLLADNLVYMNGDKICKCSKPGKYRELDEE